MRALITTGLASLLASVLTAQQQPPRDAPVVIKPGTAAITGIVLTDEALPRPLRRARVTLMGAAPVGGQTAITDDDGRFRFQDLPAGRYQAGATKDAYVPMAYGAARTGRPGSPLTLREGEKASITIRLPRGAVITGVVTDPNGQPVPQVMVQALSFLYNPVAGERQLRVAPSAGGRPSTSMTDDRGAYRIFGLPAGEYVVGTMVPSSGPDRVLQRVSTDDVRRAFAEIRGGIPSQQDAPPPLTPRRVIPAPVYYPGTASTSQATRVTVGAGEERAGIDFSARYVPAAAISGTVGNLAPDAHTYVELTATGQNVRGTRRGAHLLPDGRFSFVNIEPGSYRIVASSIPKSGAARAPIRWAMEEVTLDGDDLTGLALTLEAGLTMAGRVQFEGGAAPLGIRQDIPLPDALIFGSMPATLPPVQIDENHGIRIDGFPAASFRLRGPIRGVRTPIGSWWLKSIVVNGADLLDAPLEIKQSVTDAVVTFTQSPTELSGTVAERGGVPAADLVVVFSVDRRSWFLESRRVAGVRADAQGRYSIKNLPPGEYFITTDNTLEPGEWFDPAVLERLSADALRISLGNAEAKRVDIVSRLP